MKVTVNYLKQIIKEELSRQLQEKKKVKVTVKGKKKSVETEGAFGANYDDYDYVRDSAPGPLSDYERERQEAERRQLQQWRDEESAKRDREYRQMDDYDRSSRSDESVKYKKKNKVLDEYEYSDEKGVYGRSSPGHSSSPSWSGRYLSDEERKKQADQAREEARAKRETERKYYGEMSSGT